MHLVTTWYGTFLLDDGDVVAEERFPATVEDVARRLQAVREGRVLDEEEALAPDEAFRVPDDRLATLEGATLVDEAPPEAPDPTEEARGLLPEASRRLARERVRDSLSTDDRHVVHAVGAVDDLHETTNLLAERVRDWFGLHFPELPDLVDDAETLVTLVARHGDRDAIVDEHPGLDRDRGVGADLDPATRDRVQHLARVVVAAADARSEVEGYLEETVPEVAPNLSTLLGPSLAARLLRLAGGLEDLAKLPSGTVQTLGAEKALFRHLREDAPPPKHGVLHQHPLVHRAPPDDRGKIARALAGKVSIAARADAFTGADVADDLRNEVQARVDEIREASP